MRLLLCVLLLSATAVAVADEPFPKVETPDGKPPSDAIVLFDGAGINRFLSTDGKPCEWPVKDGALVSAKKGHLVSDLHFRDAQLHVEFRVPEKGPGNSGIYIHGQFELQIFNSHGQKNRDNHMAGSVYGIQAPLANATRPPQQWQTYDIFYRAPRRGDDGKAVEPGSITALLNGVLVQWNTPVTESKSVYNPLIYRTTPYTDQIKASLHQTSAGPVFLQDHQNPVEFRNIWVRPLDEKSHVFKGK